MELLEEKRGPPVLLMEARVRARWV